MKLYAIALLTLFAATLLFGCIGGGTQSTPTPTPTIEATATPIPSTIATATPSGQTPTVTAQPGSDEEIEQALEQNDAPADDGSAQELEQTV